MPKASIGVLIECDPAIKAIILKIDAAKHAYIVEDLDDTHLMVKGSNVAELKVRLDEELKNAVQYPDEEDDSDRG